MAKNFGGIIRSVPLLYFYPPDNIGRLADVDDFLTVDQEIHATNAGRKLKLFEITDGCQMSRH